jgi:hypothetical protein
MQALANPPDHTAAWLAFVGALLVAIIAAGTAQWRQAVALKAERERLDDQLRHDRELKDLEELRVVLDAAGAKMGQLFESFKRVWMALEGKVQPGDDDPAVTFNVDRLQTVTAVERTALRLGREHGVQLKLQEALDSIGLAWSALRAATASGTDAGAAMDPHLDAFQAAWDAFRDGAQELVASHLPPAPTAERG